MPVDDRRRSCLSRFGLAAGFVAAVLSGPAWAEDGSHPIDSALEFMGLKTKQGTMPDFVEKSRPDAKQDDYMAVGVKPPDHALKVRTPAEVKAMTAELDAARAAQLAGKRPKPPSAATTAKPTVIKPAQPKVATDH